MLCCCLSGKDLHCGRDIEGKQEGLVDYIAVYAAPTDQILGLHDPVLRVSPQTPVEVRDTYTRGIAIHEVSNICTLIQQGNHRIMEVLFSDREGDYNSDVWLSLKNQRDNFITQVVTNHYQGVGRGQLVAAVSKEKKTGLMKKQLHHVTVSADDILETPENRNRLYHALRLLSSGARIVSEHTIPTSFTGEQGKLIQGVMDGTTSIHEAVELANSLCKQVEDLKSQLDDVPRRIEDRYATQLEKWLIHVRASR